MGVRPQTPAVVPCLLLWGEAHFDHKLRRGPDVSKQAFGVIKRRTFRSPITFRLYTTLTLRITKSREACLCQGLVATVERRAETSFSMTHFRRSQPESFGDCLTGFPHVYKYTYHSAYSTYSAYNELTSVACHSGDNFFYGFTNLLLVRSTQRDKEVAGPKTPQNRSIRT